VKFFFSSPNKGRDLPILTSEGAKNFLVSYGVSAKSEWKNYDAPDHTIMIDSGAFSTWNSGKVIDFDAYIDFCLDVISKAEGTIYCVGLDEIPGSPGQVPTQIERENAVQKTLANLKYALSKGLVTIPVYHQHEPLEVLDEYLKLVEYVGLSPANDQSMKARFEFMDNVYAHLRRPIKAHSFGFSSWQVLERYPLFSCDSTSYKSGYLYRCVVDGDTYSHVDEKSREGVKMKYIMAGGDANKLTKYNIIAAVRWQNEATDLWKKRGITW
jgi:hypothetical protein